MPAEIIKLYLRSDHIPESVKMCLILNAAAVLKNVKMSCMFVVPAGFEKQICSLLYNTGIRLYILHRGSRSVEILIYREAALNSYLMDPSNRRFLEEYGYGNCSSMSEHLSLLSEHMSSYFMKNSEFPHEAGIFLGYPLDDVIGFVRNNGQNYSCCGYWKVYSDVESAKKHFRIFDQARNTAIAELVSGKEISEIAC